MKTIGVFDSGVGGLSVAQAIKRAFKDYKIDYREDSQNLPYGTKSADELYKLVLPILSDMAKTCDIIVIACNTVTTTIISRLRQEISVPLVGIEPMVKPAAQLTNSKIITVCATPATLGSKRYGELKEQFAADIKVIEPNCSDWTNLIEQNSITKKHISDLIEPTIAAGADVIVLGCTHYHWIEKQIKDIAGKRAIVIQPESAIVDRVKQVLAQLA